MIMSLLIAVVACSQLPRTLQNISCFALDLIFDLKWMLCGFALLLFIVYSAWRILWSIKCSLQGKLDLI